MKHTARTYYLFSVFLICSIFSISNSGIARAENGAVLEVANESQLRTAITNADTGAVIALQNDINLTASLTISANKTITITTAAGIDHAEIKVTGNPRHITISGARTVELTFDKVTLDGNSTGGGIYANTGGTVLTLNNPIIQNCYNSTIGSGIFVQSSSTVPSKIVVTGGTIMDNTAGTNGGGVYGNTGCLININDSTISGNIANTNGGGIYGNTGCVITVNNSIVSRNTANGSNSTSNGGGGIYGYTNSEITVSKCSIGKNTAANAYGGGIYARKKVDISGGTIISGNTAGGNGGGVYAYSGSVITLSGGSVIGADNFNDGNKANSGGGIFSSSSSSAPSYISVSNGTISYNSAAVNGGGIYSGSRGTISVDGGSITGNGAAENGGGVYIYDSEIKVLSGIISNNSAIFGGGIAIYQNFTNESYSSMSGAAISSKITLTGGTISGNTATNGGGIGNFNAFASPGSNNSAEGIIVIGGGNISDNTAFENGGGIYNYASSTHGGSKDAESRVTVMGTISGNTAKGNGGGIYGYSNGPAARSNCVISIEDGGDVSKNNAAFGGGIYGTIGNNSSLVNTDCRIIALNGAIRNNTASIDGGGVWIYDLAKVTTNGLTLDSNKASMGYKWKVDETSPNPPIKKASETHGANIIDTSYTAPFDNAYNNYDINFLYVPGITEIYYTATFDDNYETGTQTSILVSKGSFITNVLTPVRSGYVFGGWYKESNCLTPWDFTSETVISDITLYAKWTALPPEPEPTPEPPTEPESAPDLLPEPEPTPEPLPDLPPDLPPEHPPGYELIPTDDGAVDVIDDYGTTLGTWDKNKNNDWTYYGNDPVIPPSFQISPQENGSFEIIDQDEIPFGLWSKNEEDKWIYDEYPSGKNGWIFALLTFLLALAGLLFGIWFFFIFYRHVNRQEFTRMVIRKTNPEAEIVDVSPYDDITTDSKYYDDIMKAKSIGLLSGFPGNQFQGRTKITREEMASVFAGAVRHKSIAATMDYPISDYKDSSKAERHFANDIQLVLHLKIMKTGADGAFNPKRLTTRTQAAKMIHDASAFV